VAGWWGQPEQGLLLEVPGRAGFLGSCGVGRVSPPIGAAVLHDCDSECRLPFTWIDRPER
jgi:hypothetical protein